MNYDQLLKGRLRVLTNKEWEIEKEQDKWDIRFKCRLGSFRYNTEWFDITQLNIAQIKLEAEVIKMWYDRSATL